MLILRTLARGASHGWGIAQHIRSVRRGAARRGGLALPGAAPAGAGRRALSAEWGVSENNRRCRIYKLTPRGRRRLESRARALGHAGRCDRARAEDCVTQARFERAARREAARRDTLMPDDAARLVHFARHCGCGTGAGS